MAPREDRINPLFTDSPWAFLSFYGLIIGILFLGQFQPVPTPIFYPLIGIWGLITLVGGPDTDFRSLSKAFGFDAEEYAGAEENAVNILLGFMGVGFAAAVFGTLNLNLFAIYQGNAQAMQVLGIYPAATQEFLPFYAQIGTAGTIIVHFFVGLFETMQIYWVGWNMANWLNARIGFSKQNSVSFAFLVGSPIGWGATHFLAWELNLFSFPVFIAMNIIFFAAYIIADMLGVFSRSDPVRVSELLTPSAIGSHWAWNVLVTLFVSGAFIFTAPEIAVAGATLFAVSLTVLVLITGRVETVQEQLTKFEF